MDADQFRQLETELAAFLDRFGDCFSRKNTRAHLGVYVRGQLSDLPEKSVEPIVSGHSKPATRGRNSCCHQFEGGRIFPPRKSLNDKGVGPCGEKKCSARVAG